MRKNTAVVGGQGGGGGASNPVELDEFDAKIVLLSGPPGVGKTTPARVVADHAGYATREINVRRMHTHARTHAQTQPERERRERKERCSNHGEIQSKHCVTVYQPTVGFVCYTFAAFFTKYV